MGRPPPSNGADGERVSRALGLAVLGASALTVALTIGRARPSATGAPSGPISALRGAAALLGVSVFADSAVEHWRGGFRNPGMFAPVGVSALLIGANLGAIGGRGRKARAADGIHGTALALGAAGVGFHARNILRRPGAVSWQNLFHAAPVGAPVALALAGMLGLAADHTRVTAAGRLTLTGLPAGRALAALVAGGLAGTTAEAGLLHFRGNFQNRYMWLPVTLPPVAAALLGAKATWPARLRGLPAGAWLGLTAALGAVGVAFHARGVARMMGGWRNWSQNLIDGPPLPAPPAFSALALAGLAALTLIEHDRG